MRRIPEFLSLTVLLRLGFIITHTSAHIKQSQCRDSAQLIPDSQGGRTWPGPDIVEYSQYSDHTSEKKVLILTKWGENLHSDWPIYKLKR